MDDVAGLRMHALVSIDSVPSHAPAVVLVHGSGLSGRYMIPTARELTDDFRVYVPDLPGFGDSDKPPEIADVPQLADWVAAWMPAIGLEHAALLGNSFGCQIIADLAARYPDRVERAILQGPTTPPEERSSFWQFIRWRQNQRYNPPSLDPVSPTRITKNAGCAGRHWTIRPRWRGTSAADRDRRPIRRYTVSASYERTIQTGRHQRPEHPEDVEHQPCAVGRSLILEVHRIVLCLEHTIGKP